MNVNVLHEYIIYRLFEMITELGDGGFGWVYKVKHKLDGKTFALKKVDLIG